MTRSRLLLLLGSLGCNSNVVDAVREPAEMPSANVPVPPSPLETSLMHRYSFEGEGSLVLDSEGAAHGQAMGVVLPGTGQLRLAGERSAQFVDLPNIIISGLRDATFEVWLTWEGGAAWQRIFDFGNSDEGEGTPGANGTSYLFLTPATAIDIPRKIPQPVMRVTYSQKGIPDEDPCDARSTLPVGVATHVAVVIESSTDSVKLYQDGALVGDCALPRRLSAIDDVNNWLGQSNYQADSGFAGSYDEFRIYGAALTASQVADSFAAGPDAR